MILNVSNFISTWIVSERLVFLVLFLVCSCKLRNETFSSEKNAQGVVKKSVLLMVVNEPPPEASFDLRFEPLDKLSKSIKYLSISSKVLSPLRSTFSSGIDQVKEICKKTPIILVTNTLLGKNTIQTCTLEGLHPKWADNSIDLKEILNFLGPSEIDLSLSSTDRLNRRDFASIYEDYQSMLLSDRDVFQEVVRFSSALAIKEFGSSIAIDVVYWSIGDDSLGYVGIPGFSYDPRSISTASIDQGGAEVSSLKELASKVFEWIPRNLRQVKSGMSLNDFVGAFRAQSKTIKKILRKSLVANTLGELCLEDVQKTPVLDLPDTQFYLSNACFDFKNSRFFKGMYE